MIEILPQIGCSLLQLGSNYDDVISALGRPKEEEAMPEFGRLTLCYQHFRIILCNGLLFTGGCWGGELRVFAIVCSSPDAVLFGRKLVGLSCHDFLEWASSLGIRFEVDTNITPVQDYRAFKCTELELSVDFYKENLRRVVVDGSISRVFPELRGDSSGDASSS